MGYTPAAVMCFLVGSAIQAETVTFTNFQNVDVPATVDGCAACAFMNARGDLAGSFSPTSQGFYEPANSNMIVPIVFPPNEYTAVLGLNDIGTLVGYYVAAPGAPNGFTYHDGVYSPVDVGQANITSGINNNGDIVGYFTSTDVGFMIVGGSVVTSGFPDGGLRGTYPTGINDADVSVGYYYGVGNSGGSHAFIRGADGSLTTFDYSQTASYTTALAINNAGIIAGDYGDSATNSTHAFVRVDGVNYPYDPPGAADSYALSITNNNELFGSYNIPGQGPQYFVVDISIVPEPRTWETLGLALLALVVGGIASRSGLGRIRPASSAAIAPRPNRSPRT